MCICLDAYHTWLVTYSIYKMQITLLACLCMHLEADLHVVVRIKIGILKLLRGRKKIKIQEKQVIKLLSNRPHGIA